MSARARVQKRKTVPTTGMRSNPRQMSLSTNPGFTETALKLAEPYLRCRLAAKRIMAIFELSYLHAFVQAPSHVNLPYLYLLARIKV